MRASESVHYCRASQGTGPSRYIGQTHTLLDTPQRPSFVVRGTRMPAGRVFPGEHDMFQRILVPVDLTDAEFAKPALEIAANLARAFTAELRLIHVMTAAPSALGEFLPPDFDAQQMRSAQEALEIVAGEIGLGRGLVSTSVRQGGVYHEILEEAEGIGADLIVMSSHQPAMKNYLLGSNAAYVVRHARCSVLVVRGHSGSLSGQLFPFAGGRAQDLS
jgi:nucleotide-binding universal stress UspA family protein